MSAIPLFTWWALSTGINEQLSFNPKFFCSTDYYLRPLIWQSIFAKSNSFTCPSLLGNVTSIPRKSVAPCNSVRIRLYACEERLFRASRLRDYSITESQPRIEREPLNGVFDSRYPGTCLGNSRHFHHIRHCVLSRSTRTAISSDNTYFGNSYRTAHIEALATSRIAKGIVAKIEKRHQSGRKFFGT